MNRDSYFMSGSPGGDDEQVNLLIIFGVGGELIGNPLYEAEAGQARQE